MMDKRKTLRLAVPSNGALHKASLSFLDSCGIGVLRANQRKYTADIPSLPGVTVLFQRSADITLRVEEGSADMGIVGMDRVLELRPENGDTSIALESLGFGHCDLVIGVPDSWVDVTSLADLSDLSMEFRDSGKDLRIATKYPRLLSRYLLNNGVNYFSLAKSSGTLEAAPAMGYADIIGDISASGTTIRENHLKTIKGGFAFKSEACLISNRRLISEDEDKQETSKSLVESMETYLQSQSRSQMDQTDTKT